MQFMTAFLNGAIRENRFVIAKANRHVMKMAMDFVKCVSIQSKVSSRYYDHGYDPTGVFFRKNYQCISVFLNAYRISGSEKKRLCRDYLSCCWDSYTESIKSQRFDRLCAYPLNSGQTKTGIGAVNRQGLFQLQKS